MGRRHKEGSVLIAASPEIVFAYVDDHSRFSSHMSESSWMMGGGGMGVELDAAKGQAVGSHIRLSGNVFGIRLFLDEVVTRRNPPREKVWETVGPPRLLVIGSYSMGLELKRENGNSRLRVFIDYDLPTGRAARWLGRVFGGMYATWCVDQCSRDRRSTLEMSETLLEVCGPLDEGSGSSMCGP
jgi:Polyketide cyclase / dehydrase and lipid transport